MDAILKDLNSAYVKMNEQIALLDKRNAEAKVIVEKENEKLALLKKREDVIAEKEAKYKEFDNVQLMRDGVSKDRVAVNADRNVLSDKERELNNLKIALDKKQSELDNFISIFKQKNENCDKMKAQLDKDRAEMKQNILAELQKGLK